MNGISAAHHRDKCDGEEDDDGDAEPHQRRTSLLNRSAIWSLASLLTQTLQGTPASRLSTSVTVCHRLRLHRARGNFGLYALTSRRPDSGSPGPKVMPPLPMPGTW